MPEMENLLFEYVNQKLPWKETLEKSIFMANKYFNSFCNGEWRVINLHTTTLALSVIDVLIFWSTVLKIVEILSIFTPMPVLI